MLLQGLSADAGIKDVMLLLGCQYSFVTYVSCDAASEALAKIVELSSSQMKGSLKEQNGSLSNPACVYAALVSQGKKNYELNIDIGLSGTNIAGL